ncbi:MAG: sugar phosphate isomerase/epimerase [Imperialibacter sp.]|uniref:sugar phosphate isomerase/epimerase family protein n=1 Tax=Imperialibacter sp. TaxID=2038411 RepID=UPI0030D7D16F|tara:strand:+ start:9236 stop:10153 length:918 start_codon:yes stop_codon:yes gene_type:complete
MKRRDFIGTTLGAGIGVGLAASPLLASKRKQTNTPDMKIKILATNWGDGDTIEDFCKKIKSYGYDGLEVWYPTDAGDRERLVNATKANGLEYGFLVGAYQPEFQPHFELFETNLRAAAKMKPLYINCHSGKDFFSYEQNKQFIDLTIKVSKESGVGIHHETHRSRIMYSAPVTRNFIEKNPDLTLTLDISHWCNVHETLLQDQKETVDMALQRTRHIHLRVGHPESPQVNDPRAPEWKEALDQHLAWWDKVIELRKNAGADTMTFLTEFGPADYMPTIPYTRQPVANQWDINRYMLELIRNRYTS